MSDDAESLVNAYKNMSKAKKEKEEKDSSEVINLVEAYREMLGQPTVKTVEGKPSNEPKTVKPFSGNTLEDILKKIK